MDPSQEQEEATPFTVESLDSDAVLAPSPIAELNKTLNIARAFNTIRRDAIKSGLNVRENRGSVLLKDPTRSLDNKQTRNPCICGSKLRSLKSEVFSSSQDKRVGRV